MIETSTVGNITVCRWPPVSNVENTTIRSSVLLTLIIETPTVGNITACRWPPVSNVENTTIRSSVLLTQMIKLLLLVTSLLVGGHLLVMWRIQLYGAQYC